MAILDTTLDAVQIPALPTFTPEFGTKKLEGGLSTLECAQADMRPFSYQRPFKITGEYNETSEKVERNCSFVIPSTQEVDTTLVLHDATFDGCEAKVINLSWTNNVKVQSRTSGINGGNLEYKVQPNTCVTFMFITGHGWVSLPGVSSSGESVIPHVSEVIDGVSEATMLVERTGNGSLITKSIEALWKLIKNKIESVLKLSSSGYSGTAAVASKVKTVSTSTNATRYLTFVDSNNSSATEESVYTDAGISYNPSTNVFTVSGNIKSSSGSISGSQIVIPTSKPSSVVAGSIWLS